MHLLFKHEKLTPSDIDGFREEYARLKKLEAFVLSREYKRPNVNKIHVALSALLTLFSAAAAVCLPVLSPLPVAAKICLPIVLMIAVCESELRLLFTIIVKYYQKHAKEETRRRCKCVPSCSEYAVMSLKTVFPLPVALYKIRRRLFVTCNGDYKIDFPTRKANEKFKKMF